MGTSRAHVDNAFELLSPKTLHWKNEVPHCEEGLLFLSFQVVCFSGYNNF